MLKINSTSVVAPKSFQVDIQDIDADSNRNANGELLRDRVAVKRKLEMEWGPLTETEMSTLLKCVKDTFFSVSYPDPMEGKRLSKTMYVGDRTAPAYMYDKDSDTMKWQGLSMNFIEK